MELRVVRFEGTLNIPWAITATNKVSLRLRDSLDSLVLSSSSSSLLLILLVFSRSVCPFEDSTFASLDIALLNRFICVSSRETERQQTEISFILLARKPVGAKAVFLVPAGVNAKYIPKLQMWDLASQVNVGMLLTNYVVLMCRGLYGASFFLIRQNRIDALSRGLGNAKRHADALLICIWSSGQLNYLSPHLAAFILSEPFLWACSSES